HAAESAGWAAHHDTPSSVTVDALGRAVLSIARTRDGDGAIRELRVSTAFDAAGNVREVRDALGRRATRTVFDLRGAALRAEALDAGLALSFPDAAGNSVEGRDGRGSRVLRAFDVLNRPSRTWGRDQAGDALTLREWFEYGDGGDPAQPRETREYVRKLHQLGRAVRQGDEAGMVTVDEYDFRGGARERARRTLRDELLLKTFTDAAADGWRLRPFRVDWTPAVGETLDDRAAALLEEREHRVSTVHDALGRPFRQRLPADDLGARREVAVRFGRAGAPERVTVDGVAKIEAMAYDAKGRRTLLVHGNGVMTRWAYHPLTHRVARMRSERFTRPAAGAFRPTGAPLTDVVYAHDLDGNLLRTVERAPGCGVRGNPDALAFQSTDAALAALLAAGDALVRRFAYDPLGRLVSATGRECATHPSPRPWEDAPACGFGGANAENASSLTALYREAYAHDPAGNLVSLRHERGASAWTRRFGVGGLAPAAWADAWTAHADGAAWDGAPSNALTHVTDGADPAVATHAYDAAGNLVAQHTDRHFAWDRARRMTLFRAQTRAAGSTPEEDRWSEPSAAALYLYDAAGQRVKKVVRTQGGGVEITVYVDGAWERQSWRRADGAVGACALLHVSDGARRVAVLRSGDRHPDDAGPAEQVHLGDHLGSATVVVDGGGGWVNREEFTPYGETVFGGFARKRYRFTGMERDGESGLACHGVRYYASWLGRWTSTDPAGMADGPNVYAYCRGNPVGYHDRGGTEAASYTPAVDLTRKQQEEAGARSATAMQEEHDRAIDETGVGTHAGNMSRYARRSEARQRQEIDAINPAAPSPQLTSCIGFVKDTYRAYCAAPVFQAMKESEAMRASSVEAYQRAATAMKECAEVLAYVEASQDRGTSMQRSLQEHGWTTVYFDGDTTGDRGYRNIMRQPQPYGPLVPRAKRYIDGTAVGRVDVTVPLDRFVVNYAPNDGGPVSMEAFGGLQRLKQVPYAIGTVEWGRHTFVLSYGQVHEVHWDEDSTSKSLFETTPFEDWAQGWESGVIAVPPGSWKN
ncbi:MAG TPA: RHS repeat-associated core domain-containing protein, partial [Longimicrobium sp.]|nr:RHS repeat-associated core domain-containing protein [Longimicrobium sp.]